MRGPRTAIKSGPRWPQLEKALAQKRRPNTAKNKERKKEAFIKKKKNLQVWVIVYGDSLCYSLYFYILEFFVIKEIKETKVLGLSR